MLLGRLRRRSTPGEAWVGVGAAAAVHRRRAAEPAPRRPDRVGGRHARSSGCAASPAASRARTPSATPARTAATAAALMIGLALVSFVAVFAAGLRGSIDDAIDKTFASDLILANVDGFSDIPVGVGRRDRGRRRASRRPRRCATRRTSIEGDGRASGFLTLIDPATATEVLELDWDEGSPETLAGSGPTDAVIDEGWGEKNGIGVGDTVRGKYRLGGAIDLHGRRARSPTTSTSSATTRPPTSTPRPSGRRNTSPTYSSRSRTAPTRTRSGPRSTSASTRDSRRSRPRTSRSSRTRSSEQLNTLLGVVYALLLLAVIVSLFGIVNTLALSIHERTRELGCCARSEPRAARCAGSSATRP